MKKILVTGDLHCGSVYGLLPPSFERQDKKGRGYYGRTYLWQKWLDMAKATSGADVVIVNGDLTDGRQQLQQQTEMNLADTSEQVSACIECLKQLRPKKDAKWFFIKGSEYHDLRGCPTVEAIANAFHAVQPTPRDNVGVGVYSWDVLDLEVEPNVIINVQHGTGVASGFYRSTPYDREGIFSALAGKEGKMPKADCVVRSHAHIFLHLEHASKHIIAVPAWQLQTTFMRKNSCYRMIPDLGTVVIYADSKEKSAGRDPIRLEKHLYPLPVKDTTKF